MRLETDHPCREFVEKISGKIKRYGALQALRTETEGRATDWMTNPRLPQLYTTRQVDEEAKEILTDIENTLYVALDEEGDKRSANE